MTNNIRFVIVITVAIALTSCGATTKELARMSRSERTDVISETVSEGPPPAGYADLIIRASLKTHLEGYFLLESKKSARGKAVYPFLVNIDGQAVLWQVEGRKHVLPKYENGKTSHDPEAGEGMKYVLDKKVRLAAGTHKVFFGLPEEHYYVVANVFLNSGGLHRIEFEPDYRYKTLPTRIPTFLSGINKYEVLFN